MKRRNAPRKKLHRWRIGRIKLSKSRGSLRDSWRSRRWNKRRRMSRYCRITKKCKRRIQKSWNSMRLLNLCRCRCSQGKTSKMLMRITVFIGIHWIIMVVEEEVSHQGIVIPITIILILEGIEILVIPISKLNNRLWNTVIALSLGKLAGWIRSMIMKIATIMAIMFEGMSSRRSISDDDQLQIMKVTIIAQHPRNLAMQGAETAILLSQLDHNHPCRSRARGNRNKSRNNSSCSIIIRSPRWVYSARINHQTFNRNSIGTIITITDRTTIIMLTITTVPRVRVAVAARVVENRRIRWEARMILSVKMDKRWC